MLLIFSNSTFAKRIMIPHFHLEGEEEKINPEDHVNPVKFKVLYNPVKKMNHIKAFKTEST